MIRGKSTKSILIIEDEAPMRELLTQIFIDDGWRVEAAAGGEEALRVGRVFQPAVVMLDLFLSGMNGIEVLNVLRQEGWGKDARIIVMSNYDDAWLIQQTQALGAKVFLVKVNTKLTDIIHSATKLVQAPV